MDTAVVTVEERDQFDADGYLVFDPEIPIEIIDGVVRDLDGLFEGFEEVWRDGVLYSVWRILDAWRTSENVKSIARAPRVLSLLKQIYEREPLPFQTLNFPRGTEQSVHADALHFNSMPAGYMCGIWVALEDIDMDNGPLVYYPGSHKLPEATMQDLGLSPTKDDYPHYEQYLKEQIEEHSLEPAYGTIRKGQALLWASNLLHGGAPQNDKERSRLSQVTHYFFAGCRYYTPMVSDTSDEEKIVWRDPAWIV